MCNFGFHNLPHDSVSTSATEISSSFAIRKYWRLPCSKPSSSLSPFLFLPANINKQEQEPESYLMSHTKMHTRGRREEAKVKIFEGKRPIRCKCACSERQTETDLSAVPFSHCSHRRANNKKARNRGERKQSHKNFSFIVFAYQRQFRFSKLSLSDNGRCVSSSTFNCMLLVVNLVITHTD